MFSIDGPVKRAVLPEVLVASYLVVPLLYRERVSDSEPIPVHFKVRRLAREEFRLDAWTCWKMKNAARTMRETGAP